MDFEKILKFPKDHQSKNLIKVQSMKKSSFYYSDEILNNEHKPLRFQRKESIEDSRHNSAVHKITDLNITKLIEDIEYENLKKTVFLKDQMLSGIPAM